MSLGAGRSAFPPCSRLPGPPPAYCVPHGSVTRAALGEPLLPRVRTRRPGVRPVGRSAYGKLTQASFHWVACLQLRLVRPGSLVHFISFALVKTSPAHPHRGSRCVPHICLFVMCSNARAPARSYYVCVPCRCAPLPCCPSCVLAAAAFSCYFAWLPFSQPLRCSARRLPPPPL